MPWFEVDLSKRRIYTHENYLFDRTQYIIPDKQYALRFLRLHFAALNIDIYAETVQVICALIALICQSAEITDANIVCVTVLGNPWPTVCNAVSELANHGNPAPLNKPYETFEFIHLIRAYNIDLHTEVWGYIHALNCAEIALAKIDTVDVLVNVVVIPDNQSSPYRGFWACPESRWIYWPIQRI